MSTPATNLTGGSAAVGKIASYVAGQQLVVRGDDGAAVDATPVIDPAGGYVIKSLPAGAYTLEVTDQQSQRLSEPQELIIAATPTTGSAKVAAVTAGEDIVVEASGLTGYTGAKVTVADPATGKVVVDRAPVDFDAATGTFTYTRPTAYTVEDRQRLGAEPDDQAVQLEVLET